MKNGGKNKSVAFIIFFRVFIFQNLIDHVTFALFHTPYHVIVAQCYKISRFKF